MTKPVLDLPCLTLENTGVDFEAVIEWYFSGPWRKILRKKLQTITKIPAAILGRILGGSQVARATSHSSFSEACFPSKDQAKKNFAQETFIPWFRTLDVLPQLRILVYILQTDDAQFARVAQSRHSFKHA
jgi:hypothetical protein